jgi:sulfate adenylyltransferase subunit 2
MGDMVRHLDQLESEAISILRETAAAFEKPVLLYSIGKDSGALLHLAAKAFRPGKVPFPALHIDTGWKFKEMIAHRDQIARAMGIELIVHQNSQGRDEGVTPFTHDAETYTGIMKTLALREALDQHGFDAAIGGARRDEEQSRAKEKVFSHRASGHRWDPRLQRPEMWGLPNTRLAAQETMRVFPLSNWTEADIWAYTIRETIPIVPLYLAKPRPVVRRAGTWIMVDDDRLPLHPSELPEVRSVRFRTLGCYPLSGAIESQADTLDAVMEEMAASKQSERAGRLIDATSTWAMERKKREGYF